MVEAQKRVLTRADTVQSYYNDKMCLLHLFGVNDQAMVAQLTDGMPFSYQSILIGSQVSTTTQWLLVALQLEATHARSRNFHQQRKTQTVNAATPEGSTSKSFKRSSNHSLRKPPYPCRKCEQRGLTEYHWHSECTIKDKPHAQQAVTSHQPPHAQIQSQSEPIETANYSSTASGNLNYQGGQY